MSKKIVFLFLVLISLFMTGCMEIRNFEPKEKECALYECILECNNEYAIYELVVTDSNIPKYEKCINYCNDNFEFNESSLAKCMGVVW